MELTATVVDEMRALRYLYLRAHAERPDDLDAPTFVERPHSSAEAVQEDDIPTVTLAELAGFLQEE